MWETLKDVTGRPLDDPVARKSREAGDVRYTHMPFQSSSPALRKREVRSIDKRKVDTGKPHPVVKLETGTYEVMDKHRQLQENLTDEMVILAQQMKETSLRMERSLHDSEKVLDSTEQAVEHSLATTNRANIRATEISSRSWATGCFTWLLIFAMCCIFIFMIALIRVT
ncbi:hypothetical protein O6H91_04G101900 [Diphasiastrum complanatum]|nr:hypothetical protein O6H91_04G101900 [Diphasiastrum complanatum]